MTFANDYYYFMEWKNKNGKKEYLRSRCFSAASTRRKFSMEASCAFKPSIWLLGIRSAFIKLFIVEVDGIAVEVSGSLWRRWCDNWWSVCCGDDAAAACCWKCKFNDEFGLWRCGMNLAGCCANRMRKKSKLKSPFRHANVASVSASYL